MSLFKGSLEPQAFNVAVPEHDLVEFRQLLRLSKIGPETFENTSGDASFGLSRSWVAQAQEYWLSTYDWRKIEKRINSFANFKVLVANESGVDHTVHFIALRSEKQDAVPIVLLHGWPGSPLEFLDFLDLVRTKYTPSELPYTFIVPSQPGYGFSSGPALGEPATCESMARMVDKLMVGLGYGSGYIAQGGDIGSLVARMLAAQYASCKAVHETAVNFALMPPPEGIAPESIDTVERQGLERAAAFRTQGDAYAREHGQRPATIGLLLSTSPLALLIWIGEKFLDWTDQTPSLEQILDHVMLYWLTETFPRSIYPYRQLFGPGSGPARQYVEKPLGYSWFPKEIAPSPKAWVATTGNLVWHRQHSAGGHFAAMEKPAAFLNDIEDFVTQVWV